MLTTSWATLTRILKLKRKRKIGKRGSKRSSFCPPAPLGLEILAVVGFLFAFFCNVFPVVFTGPNG
jgi:hypothetical protein